MRFGTAPRSPKPIRVLLDAVEVDSQMLSGANAITLDQARNERWKATALIIWTLLAPQRCLTNTDKGQPRQADSEDYGQRSGPSTRPELPVRKGAYRLDVRAR